MKIEYEGASFLTSPSSSIEKNLIKLKLKKYIGRFLGKPYHKDPYLSLCESILSRIATPTVVDVGANIGTTIFPLARKFPESRLIAIEPHPVPAARFILNCQMNAVSNVSLVNAAISPGEGLVKIHTCPSNSGGHRITGFEGRTDIMKNPYLDCIFIPTLSLKKLFSNFNIGYCDILKIDVEGYECQVLESLEDLLAPTSVGTVIAEYGPEGMRKAGRTGWEMVRMMKEKGYQCKELKTEKTIDCPEDIPCLPDCAVTDFVFYTARVLRP